MDYVALSRWALYCISRAHGVFALAPFDNILHNGLDGIDENGPWVNIHDNW